jgi:streptomycin 6-kinase
MTNSPLIEPAFATRMAQVFGAAGRAWVPRLPELIATYAERWRLTVGQPYALSYSYAAPAVRADGTPVVLKLRVPHPDGGHELAALRHYAGSGCARLLADDEAEGALLLEQLRPGTLLSSLPDDEATAVAAEVMVQLWKPPAGDHPFPTVDEWLLGLKRLRQRYGGGTGPFPEAAVARAEAVYAEVRADAAPPVVLHGDLHHYNILAAERAPWLAIDPQGVLGEPAFEAAALLRNPSPQVFRWPDLRARTQRRLDILAEHTGLDRWRLAAWGLASGVLSEWWDVEGDERREPEPASLRVVEALAEIV